MNTQIEDIDLDTRAAAVFLDKRPSTLERWRRLRAGPSYWRLFGRPRYPISELRRFKEKERQKTWTNALDCGEGRLDADGGVE